MVLFVYDIFFVFITPFLTKVSNGLNIHSSRVYFWLIITGDSGRPMGTQLSLLVSPCQTRESIMVEVAAGPSDSASHEKVSLVRIFLASFIQCFGLTLVVF